MDITAEEARKAYKKLEKGKVVEKNGIIAEMLKTLGEEGVLVLTAVCKKVYKKEKSYESGN